VKTSTFNVPINAFISLVVVPLAFAACSDSDGTMLGARNQTALGTTALEQPRAKIAKAACKGSRKGKAQCDVLV
jgi:hypothetical protein